MNRTSVQSHASVASRASNIGYYSHNHGEHGAGDRPTIVFKGEENYAEEDEARGTAVYVGKHSTDCQRRDFVHFTPYLDDDSDDDQESDDPHWYTAKASDRQRAIPNKMLHSNPPTKKPMSNMHTPIVGSDESSSGEDDKHPAPVLKKTTRGQVLSNSRSSKRLTVRRSSSKNTLRRSQSRPKSSSANNRMPMDTSDGPTLPTDTSSKGIAVPPPKQAKPKVLGILKYPSNGHSTRHVQVKREADDTADIKTSPAIVQRIPSNPRKGSYMERVKYAERETAARKKIMSSRTSIMSKQLSQQPESIPQVDVHRCARTGDVTGLQAVLNHDTKLLECDPKHNQNALHVAARHGQVQVIRLLCQSRMLPHLLEGPDARENTPLHLAVVKSKRITQLLLKHGADATKVNARKQSPLLIHLLTAKKDDPTITALLLAHSADPNAVGESISPLHIAVDSMFFQIASCLVHYGARLDVKDRQGRMVFDKLSSQQLCQVLMEISRPPIWIPDRERPRCMLCSKKFSTLTGRLRHHCRHCGRICCGSCAKNMIETVEFPVDFSREIASKGRRDKHRVCRVCNDVFNYRSRPNRKKTWTPEYLQTILSTDSLDGASFTMNRRATTQTDVDKKSGRPQ